MSNFKTDSKVIQLISCWLNFVSFLNFRIEMIKDILTIFVKFKYFNFNLTIKYKFVLGFLIQFIKWFKVCVCCFSVTTSSCTVFKNNNYKTRLECNTPLTTKKISKQELAFLITTNNGWSNSFIYKKKFFLYCYQS